jgi:hypothetical protein
MISVISINKNYEKTNKQKEANKGEQASKDQQEQH